MHQTRTRPASLILFLVAALALAATALAGCRDEAAPAPAQQADEAVAADASFLVEGWSCAAVEGCFALHVGRTQRFERKVGGRVDIETRTLTDRVPHAAPPQHDVYVEADGTRRFAAAPGALSLELRGQLIEAVRFPARAGDHFTVDDGAGNRVTMTVRATQETRTTPAGSFGPCLVHEARFENPEQPESAGLRIETTLCQGVGEVERSIELPAMPLPVEFTLLEHDDSAGHGTSHTTTTTGTAARGDRG